LNEIQGCKFSGKLLLEGNFWKFSEILATALEQLKYALRAHAEQATMMQ